MHIHNKRNFPQAKLDSEINVPFLSNEHSDTCIFYGIIIVYIPVLSSLTKKIKFYQSAKKNDIG